ncbi:MAG: hypothetical protein Q4C16_06180 [Eubacteriales bacterium]|nr:hypothetical protein [Eubacteriales bacterium]
MIDINASPAFFVWLLPVQEADHSPIAARPRAGSSPCGFSGFMAR